VISPEILLFDDAEVAVIGTLTALGIKITPRLPFGSS